MVAVAGVVVPIFLLGECAISLEQLLGHFLILLHSVAQDGQEGQVLWLELHRLSGFQLRLLGGFVVIVNGPHIHHRLAGDFISGGLDGRSSWLVFSVENLHIVGVEMHVHWVLVFHCK